MKKTLAELADEAARLMKTTVKEVSGETIEADSGFDLASGYNFQYSPYLDNPFCLAIFSEKESSLTPIKSFKTEHDLLAFLTPKEEKIDALVEKEIASIEADLEVGDKTVIDAILRGDNWVQFNYLTDEQLSSEYADLIRSREEE